MQQPAQTELLTVGNLTVDDRLRHLYDYLVYTGSIAPLQDHRPEVLQLGSPDVLNKLASGDPGWEQMVPA